MRRALDLAMIAIVLVMVAFAIVAWVRWYTDGTYECSNCDPE